jgi:hypothetical protein
MKADEKRYNTISILIFSICSLLAFLLYYFNSLLCNENELVGMIIFISYGIIVLTIYFKIYRIK